MPPSPWIDAAAAGGIRQAFEALPAAGGTIHLPAGTYHVDEPIRLELREGQHLFLVGDGRASVLVNTDRGGGPLLHVIGVVGTWWPDLKITIRDLTFLGNPGSGDALLVEYPNDTMVDGCFFQGHGGCAVRFRPQGTNATVRDCWMRDCRKGIHAENLHHLTMHGNQTRSLQGGQEQAEHVYLDKNCREVRIVGNHFAYGQAEGIILDGTAQHVISGNTIEGFTSGVYAVACRDMVVNANYIHSPKAVHLVGECHGFSVTGNTMINTTEGGVVIEGAAGSGGHVISGNVIRKSVYGPITSDWRQGGILLGDSSNCVVNGNVIEQVHETSALQAGPAGSGHVVSSNRVAWHGAPGAVECNAPGSRVEGNVVDQAGATRRSP